MKVKSLLLKFLIVVMVIAVGVSLFKFLFVPLYEDAKKTQQIYDRFPAGSSVVLKNLDIKGNVSKYKTEQWVDILVVDKLGQPQIISVNINLLSKP